MDRLHRKGVRTVCYVDERVLGYGSSVVLCLNTQACDVLDVATEVAAMDEVQSVLVCAGPFDIVATAVFRRQSEIPWFLSSRLGRVPGIVRHELLMYQEVKPVRRAGRGGPGDVGGGAEPDVDELDMALIGELQENARESATALASRLGATRTTVLRRMKRLIDDRVISFQTLWGAGTGGYAGAAFLGLKVSPSRIRAAGGGYSARRCGVPAPRLPVMPHWSGYCRTNPSRESSIF